MSSKPGGWSPHLPFRAQIGAAADKARRMLSKVDDAEIRKARRLARRARKDDLDVVYFGDSLSSFFALSDVDRRPLHRMIREELDPAISLQTIHGGSYTIPLYSGYLRLIEASPARPVVVVPLSIRVRTVPCMLHPVHGRMRSIDYLSKLDPETPLWRIRKGFPPPTKEEWAAFHALPHPTWGREDWLIGDYLKILQARAEHDDEWVKLLYAYLHGGRVQQGWPMDQIAELGAHLRRLELPTIAYLTPVPVEKGEEFFPGFRALTDQNFAELTDAFTSGYGNDAVILQTGTVLGTDKFCDWRDATEHVNEHGRRFIAKEILDAMRFALIR